MPCLTATVRTLQKFGCGRNTPIFASYGSVRYSSNNTSSKRPEVIRPSKSLYFVSSPVTTLIEDGNRPPLAIILGWYRSKKTHLMKFADIYLDLGFDVLFTSLHGLQILWPPTGSHKVASEILTFLGQHMQYESMVVHGFSGGGYLWGETMAQMVREPEKYPDLRDHIKGHIWDSFVDWDGVPRGTAKSVFPKDGILQSTMEKTLNFYGKVFYNQTTKNFQNSSKHFHYTPIKSPVLYIGSEDDPIAPFDAIKNSAMRSLENDNQVFVRSWPSSPHVGHYLKHREEYRNEMLKFLQVIGILSEPQMRMAAKT